jgi:hypothetical protein
MPPALAGIEGQPAMMKLLSLPIEHQDARQNRGITAGPGQRIFFWHKFRPQAKAVALNPLKLT